MEEPVPARSTGEPLVVHFDDHLAGTEDERRSLLGGKGFGLVEMARDGLPIPPGFVLTTAAFRHVRANGWDQAIDSQLSGALERLEMATGLQLGDPTRPLLVSVRSGAAVSMPGMMDTVLNAGMNEAIGRGLLARTGDESFAADTASRAARSFVEVVGEDPPADPADQIRVAVQAVFASWDAPRARAYRDVETIDHDLGTAVTVQAMVFGNLGARSGTGVAFTRDPATGARGLMGDFLPGAQGEDVVAGGSETLSLDAMAAGWPDQHADLVRIADRLERSMADLVDLEFTVEDGTLWILQARRGKRSPIATLRIAIDMADDPDFPLDRAGAVARCRHLLDRPPTVAAARDDPDAVIATGLAASPGRGTGVLSLDPDEAIEIDVAGRPVVLARTTTSPADVHGMAVAAGLFTTKGGHVSHAAVVARDWGIPAVVGAGEAVVEAGGVRGPGGFVPAGEVVTVDGDRGVLVRGGDASAGTPAPEVLVLRRWAAEADGVPVPASTPAPTGGTPGGAASDEDALLHALAVKGMAGPPGLAAMLGRDLDEVEADLERLRATGQVTHMAARDLWRLSDDGRHRHTAFLTEVRSSCDLDALPYDAFLALDDRFKAVCTDWQVRDGQANDHEDAAYDAAVVTRLEAIHADVLGLLPGMADVLPWIARYADRLADARRRIGDGDRRALTGVLCDSYHDIWMELHQDLLVTQGIDRAAEGST